MAGLTKEQEEYYLSHRGECCPVCHSKEIEGDNVLFNDYTDEATEVVRCLDCGVEWEDTLEIVSVKLLNKENEDD